MTILSVSKSTSAPPHLDAMHTDIVVGAADSATVCVSDSSIVDAPDFIELLPGVGPGVGELIRAGSPRKRSQPAPLHLGAVHTNTTVGVADSASACASDSAIVGALDFAELLPGVGLGVGELIRVGSLRKRSWLATLQVRRRLTSD